MNTYAPSRYVSQSTRRTGFTIVELLIVIVVIAILAAVTIVSYNGISNRAKEASLKSDLNNGVKQLQVAKTTTGVYLSDTSTLKKSDTTTFQYVTSGETFCLSATNSQLANKTFYVNETGYIQEGTCPVPYIQTITAAACSTTRTMVADARDNRSYWIQKLADGKCWMLTNLAYAGGGTNTYSDVKTIANGAAFASTITTAYYYVPPTGSNPTTYPTQPSTSTDGGATTPQYGYLYNWCAAMGVQTATNACLNASTPASNPAISICPAGWRLPSGGPGGEVAALNTAINSGSLVSDAGLKSTWLAQQGGYWWDGFTLQGGESYYWTSTPHAGTTNNGYHFYFDSGFVYATTYDRKMMGISVRCTAS